MKRDFSSTDSFVLNSRTEPSLLMTIILVFILLVHLVKDWNRTIEKRRGLLMILVLGLLAHVFMVFTFTHLRYGYSNWEYKNILTMEFRKASERTN